MKPVRCAPCGAEDTYDTTGQAEITCCHCGTRLALYPGEGAALEGRRIGGAYRVGRPEASP